MSSEMLWIYWWLFFYGRLVEHFKQITQKKREIELVFDDCAYIQGQLNAQRENIQKKTMEAICTIQCPHFKFIS